MTPAERQHERDRYAARYHIGLAEHAKRRNAVRKWMTLGNGAV